MRLALFTIFPEVYSVKWVDKRIKTSTFSDKNIKNPPTLNIGALKTHQSLQIGQINIDQSFFEGLTANQPFPIEDKDIKDFDWYTNFTLINNNYLYYSVENDLQRRISSFMQDSVVSNDFFSKCKPGDVLVSFKTLFDKNFSVFGYMENNTIRPKLIDGIRFGSAERGEVNLKKLAYNFEPAYYGSFTISEMVPEKFFKLFIIFGILRFIFKLNNNYMTRSYLIIIAGNANFMFRCIMYCSDDNELMAWIISLVSCLTIGFITKIWYIDFHGIHFS